jgi:Tfp pilus assembly protein PilN
MKTRINLYSTILLPAKLRLSFNRLAFALLGLIGISLLVSGITLWSTQSLMADIQAKQNVADSLSSQKQQLEQAIADRKPSQELVAQVELLEQRLTLKQQLKGELLQRSALVNAGYAALLSDLAQAGDPNIWLSGIQVSDNIFEFEGYSQSPQSIPLWIERLKESETLKGYGFSSMTLNRGDDKPLAFKLSSQRAQFDNKEAK